jgi:hypothetical protein
MYFSMIMHATMSNFSHPSQSLKISRVGICMPTIEARFENLNVKAEANVGSRALPTFFNFIANTIEVNHV